jgi:non-specific serine/threonine protein kinase
MINTTVLDCLTWISGTPSIDIYTIIQIMMIQTIQCLRNYFFPSFRLSSERRLSSAFAFRPASLRSSSIKRTQYRSVALSSKWTWAPKIFPSSEFQLLDPSVQFEEETLPTYCPEKYYPVRQGEVFHDRYQIIAKLGYGVTLTVWFSRDLV